MLWLSIFILVSTPTVGSTSYSLRTTVMAAAAHLGAVFFALFVRSSNGHGMCVLLTLRLICLL